MLFEGNAFFLLFLVTPVDLARLFLESFSQKVKFDSGQASGTRENWPAVEMNLLSRMIKVWRNKMVLFVVKRF